MRAQQEFGLQDACVHMIRDIAHAVSQRPNESKEQQFVRAAARPKPASGQERPLVGATT